MGALFDRYGPRPVYLAALALFGGGMLIASGMETLWEAAIGLGLMVGMGVAGTGMAVSTGLVSRWFTTNLTLAMAIAYSGLSVGMITVAPATQLVIEAAGWRTAYLAAGTLLLGLVPLLALLPWRRIGTGRVKRPEAGRSFLVGRAVLSQAPFWGLFGVFFFTSIAIWSVMLQTVAYLVDVGFDPLVASTAYGAVGAMSIAGIIGTGWLADRYGRRRVITGSYALTITGILLLWSLGQAPVVPLLVTYVVVFGITMGARGPVVSSLVARLYPGNVSAVYGTVTIGLGLGSAAGGFASGLLHDLTGGYGAVFALSIAASLVALAPFWALRPIADGRWPEEERPCPG
jgi:MFS family permease